MSAAGSDLWNHHTSPARRCSAAAAPPPPPPPQPPLFVPPSSATASAAPTGHRYALPPPRPPASPSSLRPLPPSPPRRRRRLHRRRRLLLRAPLVFIESKQASWRRPPSPSQRAPRPPPPLQHPGRPLAAAAGRDHSLRGGWVAPQAPPPGPPPRWAAMGRPGALLARSARSPLCSAAVPRGPRSPSAALRFAIHPLFLLLSQAVHFCLLSPHRFLGLLPLRAPVRWRGCGAARRRLQRRLHLPEETCERDRERSLRLLASNRQEKH